MSPLKDDTRAGYWAGRKACGFRSGWRSTCVSKLVSSEESIASRILFFFVIFGRSVRKTETKWPAGNLTFSVAFGSGVPSPRGGIFACPGYNKIQGIYQGYDPQHFSDELVGAYAYNAPNSLQRENGKMRQFFKFTDDNVMRLWNKTTSRTECRSTRFE
jgi:hypothetical protein